LEERRTQAVYTRRASDRNSSDGLGVLDAAAIDKVKTEAWPEAANADELHDALMLVSLMMPGEIYRSAGDENADEFISTLLAGNRATHVLVTRQHSNDHEVLECSPAAPLSNGEGVVEKRRSADALQSAGATQTFYIAAERIPMLRAIYPDAVGEAELMSPESIRGKTWERADAIRELVRGRMEVCGPITVGELADELDL
jgi:ATP-dependent Lhr-like helicase